MSLALRRYENLLRPVYEQWATLAWLVAALTMAAIAIFTSLPRHAFAYMAVSSLVMAFVRGRQALELLDYKTSLAGRAFAFMRASILVRLMRAKPGYLWLGFGFDWQPQHTQRVSEIRKLDDRTIVPPDWFLRFRGLDPSKKPVGKPWIHGVEPEETHNFVPLDAIEGHTIVWGTTGAGKTRLFEVLITQAVLRGDVVIIVDPKGDKDMKALTEAACQIAGRPEAFLHFHPAFPSKSIRFDALATWNTPTELASRIAELMMGDEQFKQMGWKAIYVVSEALVYCDRMPNLMKLRRYIEGGPEKLMEEVLRTYLTANVPRWETLVAPFVNRAREGKLQQLKISGTPELLGYITFYKSEIPEAQRTQEVDGLLAMVEHNREHLGKILASLVPLLVQLTAGELGKMLSPDPEDMDDPRPIFSSAKVVEGGYVLYMGLDSLSNATVAQAVGSITLADVASHAGNIYNYGDPAKMKKIHLFIDEAAEVVNKPLIQILNKARGAGFVVTLAAQTYPDFISRLGDENQAAMIIGNCNNMIALRTIDPKTQEFITNRFGMTYIQSLRRGIGQGAKSDDAGMHFTVNTSSQIQETEVQVVSPEILGMLSNLHCFAFTAGGRLTKVRLPKLIFG